MTKYIIEEGWYEQSVGEESDAKGYPIVNKEWHSSETYESNHEPEKGEAWIFKKDGKIYEKKVVSVSFEGMVWEDTEKLHITCSVRELQPTDYSIQSERGKYGVINGNGETIIPFIYDDIIQQKGHYAKVRDYHKWGIFNTINWSVVIDVECEDILFDYPHHWMVCKDGVWQFYDCDFKPVSTSSRRFYNKTDLENGLSVCHTGRQWSYGVLDSEMRIVIPFCYISIDPLGKDGLMKAYGKSLTEDENQHDRLYHIYDSEGHDIYRCETVEIKSDGLLKVSKKTYFGKLYDFIDYKGNSLFPHGLFHELSDFDSEGYALAVQHCGLKKKYFRLHRSGKVEPIEK